MLIWSHWRGERKGKGKGKGETEETNDIINIFFLPPPLESSLSLIRSSRSQPVAPKSSFSRLTPYYFVRNVSSSSSSSLRGSSSPASRPGCGRENARTCAPPLHQCGQNCLLFNEERHQEDARIWPDCTSTRGTPHQPPLSSISVARYDVSVVHLGQEDTMFPATLSFRPASFSFSPLLPPPSRSALLRF